MIHIPVSIGELIDKLTILSIKMAKITNEDKLRNISFEFNNLNQILETQGYDLNNQFAELYNGLHRINLRLWELEDEIRELTKAQDHGAKFVAAAIGIHETNDMRMYVKGQINQIYKSAIVEEKSYKE
jgi:hypothetical protein